MGIASGERITSEAIVARADGRVVHHAAVGIEATGSRTRILAALINAGQSGRTLSVQRTLWPAVGRTANEIGQTGAHSRLTHDTALGVATAGTGYARILIGLRTLWLILPRGTAHERIAAVAGSTRANRVVVGHLADGLVTTGARTWVDAPLVHASSVLGALGTDRALRSTGGRSANVIGDAGADRMSVHLTALAVRTAWRGTAGLNRWGH